MEAAKRYAKGIFGDSLDSALETANVMACNLALRTTLAAGYVLSAFSGENTFEETREAFSYNAFMGDPD